MILTVAKRIWGGFTIITLLLIFIGVSSLLTLNNIADSTQKVNERSMPALKSSTSLQVEFVKMGKLALQSFYAKNTEDLKKVSGNYAIETKLFNESMRTLEEIADLEPSLLKHVDSTQGTYSKFDKNVNDLFIARNQVLNLDSELTSLVYEIETLADDATSMLLDLSDIDNIDSEFPRVLVISETMESDLATLVAAIDELIGVESESSLTLISGEINYIVELMQKQVMDIKSVVSGEEANGAVQEVNNYITKLSVILKGNNSIVTKKKESLNIHTRATELLALSERNIAIAISDLNKLVAQTDDISVAIENQVNESVESGSLENLIIMVISIIIAIIISAITVRSIVRPLARVNKILHVVASGDMTQKLDDAGKDEFGQLATNCNTLIDSLQTLIKSIISGSTQLAAASEETSTITNETTKAIESQCSQIEQAATATTEMSSTSEVVLQSANDALERIGEANTEANNVKAMSNENKDTIILLSEEIDQASQVINKLHHDSASIGKILDVIRGIADQTNLLALNAAIEAARAGEQGRGFAVVADEVRSLASKTQASTQEIQAMIEALQTGAKNAVTAMDKGKLQANTCVTQSEAAYNALEKITGAIEQANDASLHISESAKEQHQVSSEISERLESIVAIADQTAGGASQTASASQEVAELAEGLRLSVDEFKV